MLRSIGILIACVIALIGIDFSRWQEKKYLIKIIVTFFLIILGAILAWQDWVRENRASIEKDNLIKAQFDSIQKVSMRRMIDDYDELNGIALQLSSLSQLEFFGLKLRYELKMYPTHKEVFRIYEKEWQAMKVLRNKSEILLIDSIKKLWDKHYEGINFYVTTQKNYMDDPKNDWANNQIDSFGWKAGYGDHFDELNKLWQTLFNYSLNQKKMFSQKLTSTQATKKN